LKANWNSTVAVLFDRYYALILVLALPAPLWLGVIFSQGAARLSALNDVIVWSGLLLTGWLVTKKIPSLNIRGKWCSPTKQVASFYLRLLFLFLIIDFGSKAFFFRWDRPGQVEVFKNFGLHSVFHPTPFEAFHVFLMLYFVYLFLLGPLFFRFFSKGLDLIWLISSASAFGGAAALVTERLFFDGVHNSFYFAGPLMWLCPPCTSPRFISYAWTPADFFWHAAFIPFFVLIASYFVPVPSQSDHPS